MARGRRTHRVVDVDTDSYFFCDRRGGHVDVERRSEATAHVQEANVGLLVGERIVVQRIDLLADIVSAGERVAWASRHAVGVARAGHVVARP